MHRHALTDEQWLRLRPLLPWRAQGRKRRHEVIDSIHSKPDRKRALPLDRKLYGLRYLVELFCHKLKRFRAVATRYEKTRRSYLALVQVVSVMLWLA